VLVTNGGDGNLVDVAPGGSQTVKTIDTTGQGAGTLFGLALTPKDNGVYFVNDGDNTLDILH
jgi:DNA-binding beta-propeller fold protein YncE